jgi:hypothetical protein
MRKINQAEVDRITDPSLKAWARHSMLNGAEIPESKEEWLRIAQQELDTEIFRMVAIINNVQGIK